MYAVVTRVRIDPNRLDEANRVLHETVVPRTREREGFVSAHYLRSTDGTRGTAFELYETEAAAKEAATQTGPPEGAPVEVDGTEVCEVIAEASSKTSITDQLKHALARH
jgi:hypothetical protein